MRSYLEAKAMAISLRHLLSHKSIDLTQSESLEIVAQQFGLKDWNTLSAKIKANSKRRNTSAISDGWFEFMPLQGDHFRVGHDGDESGAAFIERVSELEHSERMMQKTGHLTKDSNVEPIAGKRYLLTAELKGKEVSKAGIFLRIDGQTLDASAFSNTIQSNVPEETLTGTFDWSKRSILLTAPANPKKCVYGFSMRGLGSVWAREFKVAQLDN